MKKITAKLLVALLAGVFLISCDRRDPVIDSRAFDFELAGSEYAEGVEYVFDYLKSRNVRKNGYNRRELLDFADAGTREFLQKSRLLVTFDRIISIDESEKPFVCNAGVENNQDPANRKKLCPPEPDHVMTKRQKMFLEEIDLILNDNYTDVQDIIERLTHLDERIRLECSCPEKNILLCATSIGRHSCRYWHDNLRKWLDEFEPESGLKGSKPVCWKEVVKNDVANGFRGGVAGALAGDFEFSVIHDVPGWAAGAIGGAISGSVGNVVFLIP